MSGLHECKSIVLKDFLDSGFPGPEHFDVVTTSVDSSALVDGAILVQVHFISADPYLRGSIKSTGSNKPGAPMTGFVSGKVLQSRHSGWIEGDLIGGSFPFSTVQIITKEQIEKTMAWKLTGFITEEQLSWGIGVMGMPGSTAYGGLLDVLRPQKGETLFVSAAAGVVGSLVGMLAKSLFGCRVIGSCGGPEKCAIITTEFGFDAAIDYKAFPDEASLTARLKEVAPDGIDMYFENVGGIHFQAAKSCLRVGGRIAVCGSISEYNNAEPPSVTINPLSLIYTFQRIEGFMCGPWLRGTKGNFLVDMKRYLDEGIRTGMTYTLM